MKFFKALSFKLFREKANASTAMATASRVVAQRTRDYFPHSARQTVYLFTTNTSSIIR
jgi:hypothetical protein